MKKLFDSTPRSTHEKSLRALSTATAAAIALLAGFQALAADAPEPIHWLTGPVTATAVLEPAEARQKLTALAARPDVRHFVLQFNEPMTPKTRTDLEAAGVKLLQYVGSNAFFATRTAVVDAPTISRAASFLQVAAIERAWKLHPMLHAGEVPEWAVVNAEKVARENVPPVVGAYMLFHPDIRLDPDGIAIAESYGAEVKAPLFSVNGLVIEISFPNIDALADHDAVQWIEPPLPEMEGINDSNRTLVGANIVQAPPYGLNGAGVNVLVYDAGTALASHQDFGGRLFVRDSSGLINHATHVAGTVGGSGAASGGNFRGMAPGVTIQSYGFQYNGSGIFLYSNPGDMEADYNQAINTHGAHISNNSIGTNTCANGFPCSITGDYGVTSALIDAIVRGSLGTPFRVVWANGNERSCSGCPGEHQAGYHSTAPPSCAKNHLTVGALNSNNDTMTGFSSWGPCDDGRLKPDVSAPGCQSNGDGGVTSCSSSGGYSTMCGTSMASPTVCGLGALLLQDFRIQFPGRPDFRNSTLRAMLAHTAEERGNPGPDYQFGYGSVRIQPAVDFMRSGNFLEAEVAHGAAYSALVIVSPGDPVLKITLAWDDVAAAPNVNPSLVNDLDLVVFDPSSTQRFPWTLNPATPSASAVQNQADRRNNIEQVYVASPAPGAWRVEVRGFNVPQGPQPFSLMAAPTLVDCSTQGVITLDRSKYACESTATIQVVDCDLNTDDGVIETVTVNIRSTTEAAGEDVVLTETAAESAAFRGTISLSATDASGVLHVAPGDTVTALYVDADDGFGGINVNQEAAANVDCTAPVISNVQVTGLGPFTATITFATNELASGAVRYGLSCASLTGQAAGSGFNTAHAVPLTGLSEDSTYFFVIDAEDQAGNGATANNGGNCYSFTTPDIPNYFTEEFTGDNDTDFTTMLFTPNGSFDYYSGCAESISTLPVNPAGGTNLTFSPSNDDGFATINLAGGATVSLYGTAASTFYVGSNGYVTFGSGDSDYSETLAEHFARRRIAGLFDDLNPGAGGSVSWKQLPDRAVVTWQGVPEYNTSNSNTFQIDMGFDGTIRISYLGIAAADGIAGLSNGTGLPSPFFETDLSGMGGCADCNENGVPDSQDILDGTSDDCNANLVPDECETNLQPEIVRQPGSRSACEGESVWFAVLANGSGSMTYQWYKGPDPISGANADLLTIDPVEADDAGTYSAVVTDACGSVTTIEVVLSVTLLSTCEDNNPCTLDGCSNGDCRNSPESGLPCDDGDPCTESDICLSGGGCAGTPVVSLYGDIAPPGGDGVVEVGDLLCSLMAYDDPSNCGGADINPCGGDGQVEVGDILAMLDAIAGNPQCPNPCGP